MDDSESRIHSKNRPTPPGVTSLRLYVGRFGKETTGDDVLNLYRILTGKEPTPQDVEATRKIFEEVRTKQQPSA